MNHLIATTTQTAPLLAMLPLQNALVKDVCRIVAQVVALVAIVEHVSSANNARIGTARVLIGHEHVKDIESGRGLYRQGHVPRKHARGATGRFGNELNGFL